MSLKYLVPVILLLVSQPLLQAQTLTPTILPGEIPSALQEVGGSRFVLSLRMSTDFDDNVLSTARSKQSDVLTLIEPDVGWNLSRSKAQWTLSYRPGFSASKELGVYNFPSQLLNTGFQIALTNRLRLRARESFLQTSSAFEQLQASELTPATSVLDRPNSAVIRNTRMSNEQVGADLTYALGRRALTGVSGTFYSVRYLSSNDQRTLASAQATGMQGFYSYQLTRRNSMGLDLSVRNLVSQDPRGHSLVEALLYTHALLLTPNTRVSFFLGPEHSVLDSGLDFLPPNKRSADSPQTRWSWTAGANYTWTHKNTFLLVAWSRRISDGAALQGIAQLSSASVELKQALTNRWRINVLTSEDHTERLPAHIEPLAYLSAACGATRALTPRLFLEVRYWHAHVTTADPTIASLTDHNRVSTSLIYDFTGPFRKWNP
jgi:hypothetical protein